MNRGQEHLFRHRVSHLWIHLQNLQRSRTLRVRRLGERQLSRRLLLVLLVLLLFRPSQRARLGDQRLIPPRLGPRARSQTIHRREHTVGPSVVLASSVPSREFHAHAHAERDRQPLVVRLIVRARHRSRASLRTIHSRARARAILASSTTSRRARARRRIGGETRGEGTRRCFPPIATQGMGHDRRCGRVRYTRVRWHATARAIDRAR